MGLTTKKIVTPTSKGRRGKTGELRKLPRPPAKGTAAADLYIKAVDADLGFFNFIISVVLHGDYAAYVAKQVLDGKDYKDKDPSQLASTNPGPRTRYLRKNSQALLEMFVSRLVDNFQKYLVDLIREVLRSKPSMLSSRQQSLTLEELLKYERIEDLVQDIIERKVNALSYEGFAALETWCSERGIQINVPASQRADVVELIATRNIIAHNRGLIDERYTRTVRSPKFAVGECRSLEVDEFFDGFSLLNSIVIKTDKAAREKFELATVRIARPTKRTERRRVHKSPAKT